MASIKEILMTRDGVTEVEAEELIKEAQSAIQEYLAEGDIWSAEDVCSEYFGLEPDYIFDLI